jgi:predicted Zn-dependent peptidase
MLNDPKFKVDVLSNGLKIITTPMEYVNTVSIHILVNVGLWNGQPISNNKAHYIEHLIASEIVENIVSKNILLYNYNASTYNDKTEYYVNCLKGNFNIVLNKILDIFYKIFNDYKIKEHIFEREKAAIIREHTNDLLSDDNIIMLELLKLLFPKSYLYVDDNLLLKNTKPLKIKELEKFLKEYYIPNNTIISISGNFKNKNKIIKIIKNKFENIPENKVIKLEHIPIKYKYKYKQIILPKYNNESKILINFHFGDNKDMTETEKFGLSIISTLLNLQIGHNEEFSLLYRLRNKNKWVYSVSSDLYLGKYSIFQISTDGIDNKLIKKVVQEIINILKYYKTKKIDKDKLKKYIYNQETLDESFSKRFINSAFYSDYYSDLVFRGDKNYLGKELTYLKKVTPENIKSICNKFFVKNNCKILLIGKYKSSINIDI